MRVEQPKKSYDFVIVGFGIVGSILLHEILLKHGHEIRVLVLDAGRFSGVNGWRSLNSSSTSLKLKNKSRYFGSGGGSNVWGSLHALFDKELYEKAYKQGRVPFDYNTYLENCGRLREYGFPEVTAFKYQERDYRLKKFVKTIPNIRLAKFSYLLEEKNIDFIDLSECISFSENHIEFKVLNGLYSVNFRKLFLTAGTLENIKIISNSVSTQDIPFLGRHFANHPKGVIWSGSRRYLKGYSELITKKEGVYTSYLGFQIEGSESYLKMIEGYTPINTFNMLRRLNDSISDGILLRLIIRLIHLHLRLIRRLTQSSMVSIECFAEVKPNYHNHVSYNEGHFKVDYNLSNKDRDALEVLRREFVETFVKSRYRLRFLRNMRLSDSKWDASHHMGGLCFSNSIKEGVVDSECRLHFNRDVFVISNGCWYDCDVVNPTMSTVALVYHVNLDL